MTSFNLFSDVNFHFHDVGLCNVVFSHQTYEIHVNASGKFKVLGGISFHVMAENWKH